MGMTITAASAVIFMGKIENEILRQVAISLSFGNELLSHDVFSLNWCGTQEEAK